MPANSTHSNEFDLYIYGRRSKTKRLSLSQKKAQLWRLVKRTPEVLVKVSGGGKTAKHVKSHLDYITRNGKLQAITDQSEKISGRQEVKELVEDWDLDITRNQGKYRQAFNIVLSMPKNTDAQKVYQAAQAFAREKFWGQHQYIMVLHEDTDHPHVHLVVKAENMVGKRLYIRKATLQEWRENFADKMYEQGIEANATPRATRGNTCKAKKMGIYFAEKRGKSEVLKSKLLEIQQEFSTGKNSPKPWEENIIKRRQVIIKALLLAAKEMKQAGDEKLASALMQFSQNLPKLETERHKIKRQLFDSIKQSRQLESEIKMEPKQHRKEQEIDR